MNCKVVESREIVWCENDDRYVLIIRSNDEIVGLNFMQGDDLELFKMHYSHFNTKLTDFYNAIVPYLVHEDTREIDRINAAIWAFFEYRNLRDVRKYKLNEF